MQIDKIILVLYIIFISCNVPKAAKQFNDQQNGEIVETEGVVIYTFNKIGNFYCLRYIQFIPSETLNISLNKSNIFYFYDERRFNFELIKLEPTYQIFFGEEINYLYNYEKLNSKFNLRNSQLLMNNVVEFPYYKTTEAYKSINGLNNRVIVAFNVSATLNFYLNTKVWLERDIIFTQNNEIDSLNSCYRYNLLTESNIVILNECDSVWPLNPKQIITLNLEE
ncbi:MAG: hypothetical protein WAT43_19140 [Chitinophagales bacterium]